MKTALPDIPSAWLTSVEQAGKTSPNGFVARLFAGDEQNIIKLSKRYGVPRATILRILLYNALLEMSKAPGARIDGVWPLEDELGGACGAYKNTIKCPSCGDTYMDTAREDGDFLVRAQAGGCSDMIRITYECHGCDAGPVLVIHNHKGTLATYWDVDGDIHSLTRE